jgi:isoquinoline 1-oxidoreductase subunit alpha
VISLNVNGKYYNVTADPNTKMLWVLRDILGLTGTKYGCGIEACGACTILLDGQPEKSCDMDVTEGMGRKIVTIEGLAATVNGQKLQQAWITHQVPQCGYCQSGMIVACAGAMNAGQTGANIFNEVDNLCVCGTYQRIKEAVSSIS